MTGVRLIISSKRSTLPPARLPHLDRLHDIVGDEMKARVPHPVLHVLLPAEVRSAIVRQKMKTKHYSGDRYICVLDTTKTKTKLRSGERRGKLKRQRPRDHSQTGQSVLVTGSNFYFIFCVFLPPPYPLPPKKKRARISESRHQ